MNRRLFFTSILGSIPVLALTKLPTSQDVRSAIKTVEPKLVDFSKSSTKYPQLQPIQNKLEDLVKSTLFEFNDDITRRKLQIQADVVLKEAQQQRLVYDYKVVCDTTNNTPWIISNNKFVVDVYLKPSRSINFSFLQWNIVAVRSGVDFGEIAGKI